MAHRGGGGGPAQEAMFKTLVVGPPNVGKTSFVRRHTLQHFAPTIHTIGCEFSRAEVADVPVLPVDTLVAAGLGDGAPAFDRDAGADSSWSLAGYPAAATEDVALCVWDLAGQDRAPHIVSTFARGAEGCLVMCDATTPSSWEQAVAWKRSVDAHTGADGGPPIPVVFLVNKCDVARCAFSADHMRGFCRQHGFVGWAETSAKTGEGVAAALRLLAAWMIARRGPARAAAPDGPAPRRPGYVLLTEAGQGRTAFDARQSGRRCGCRD